LAQWWKKDDYMGIMHAIPGANTESCFSSVYSGNKYSHMEGPVTCKDGVCTQKFVHTTYPAAKLASLKVEGYMIYQGAGNLNFGG